MAEAPPRTTSQDALVMMLRISEVGLSWGECGYVGAFQIRPSPHHQNEMLGRIVRESFENVGTEGILGCLRDQRLPPVRAMHVTHPIRSAAWGC